MNSEHTEDFAQKNVQFTSLQKQISLDTPINAKYDRLTRLASKITGCSIALLSLVDQDREFLKSAFGLPEPLASGREIALSHSFCQHVVELEKPLIITDARQDTVLKDSPIISDFDFIAYLGIPLSDKNGQILGAFSIIETQPRAWSSDEVDIVQELAQAAIDELELDNQINTRTAEQIKVQSTLMLQEERIRALYEIATLNLAADDQIYALLETGIR
ncbi:MAG: GAF domain-containing protein, partial [Chloroflexota bacterium]